MITFASDKNNVSKIYYWFDYHLNVDRFHVHKKSINWGLNSVFQNMSIWTPNFSMIFQNILLRVI